MYDALHRPVFVITHSMDTRYTTTAELYTHDQEHCSAYATDTLASIQVLPLYQTAQIVIVEEAQFFTGLKEFVLRAVEVDEKTVFCVGLDGDFRRRPFGEILDLVPFCDTIEKRHAVCTRCRAPALFTARMGNTNAQIQVGGAELYEPLCRAHYLQQEFVH